MILKFLHPQTLEIIGTAPICNSDIIETIIAERFIYISQISESFDTSLLLGEALDWRYYSALSIGLTDLPTNTNAIVCVKIVLDRNGWHSAPTGYVVAELEHD